MNTQISTKQLEDAFIALQWATDDYSWSLQAVESGQVINVSVFATRYLLASKDYSAIADRLRLIESQSRGNLQVRVFNVDSAYVCRLYENGVIQTHADYFTSSRPAACRAITDILEDAF